MPYIIYHIPYIISYAIYHTISYVPIHAILLQTVETVGGQTPRSALVKIKPLRPPSGLPSGGGVLIMYFNFSGSLTRTTQYLEAVAAG